MSNIIPIVSSSPPPIEDAQSFGWGDDDDDDDFGNFASAPNVGFAGNDVVESETPGFDVNWSHAGSSVFQPGCKDFSPPPITERDISTPNRESAKNESAVEENGKGSPYISGSVGSSSPSKSDSVSAEGGGATESDAGLGADNDDDDFADFAAFQDESSNKLSKPQLGSLPLQNPDHGEEGAVEDHEDSTKETVEPSMEKSRESTTTDSGVFSTDISPLPKSDSCSEGDRIMQSEDETFTELPQDTHQESTSSAVAGHSSSESDPKQMQENFDLSFDSRLDTSQNEDTGDKTDGLSSRDESQAEVFEQGENLMQKESGPSEQEESSVDEQKETDAPATALEADTSERAADKEVEDCSNKEIKTELCGEIDTAAEHSADVSPSPDSPMTTEKEKGSSNNLSGDEEDEEWAVFETSHSTPTPAVPDSEYSSHSQQTTEPEDLVLRTNSVDFDQEAICDDENFEEFSTTVSDIKAKDIPSKLSSPDSNTPGNQTPDEEESGDDGLGDSSSQPQVHRTIPDDTSKEETDSKVEDKAEHNQESNQGDFADFSEAVTVSAQTLEKGEFAAEEEDDFGDFSSKEAAQGDSEDEFGDFSAKEVSADTAENEFGDFSSKDSKGDPASNDDIDNDDFGDFSSQPASSVASAGESEANDFGAFSAKPGADSDAEDDFGDFSSQAATASAGDSGWADFSGPSSVKTNTEGSSDFGDFSDTKPTPKPDSIPTSGSHVSEAPETKFEKALSNCFPGYSNSAPLLSEEEENESTTAENESTTETTDVDKFGMLATILKYGLRFRSASLQTWQVVQHPSKKDPRVRLWGHLKDVDGSQAVIYQWAKSHTNALLFNTLHIDTQNMLIGHKKVSVPIFATGLSLLEPIRGGERDRGLGMAGQLSKGAGPPMAPVAPTLVDPNQQYVEQPAQEIPAVDFDWSTSGLTNPLTSKSLDLDFLVVQDNDASEKPSDEWDWVFESELLDAPRSSVKTTHPLEDILKSVKPTSVNRRRDDAATSQMSGEASRVLAGLPDLSFMHSKVLMFPIKN